MTSHQPIDLSLCTYLRNGHGKAGLLEWHDAEFGQFYLWNSLPEPLRILLCRHHWHLHDFGRVQHSIRVVGDLVKVSDHGPELLLRV